MMKLMRIEDFHALKVGPVAQPDGATVTLTVHNLGNLKLDSGRLGACDPFVQLDNPLITRVEPGIYPVRVTVADVSDNQDGSHIREAFLSVVLAEGTPASVEPAESEGSGPPPIGEYFGVGVDAGTVGFVDAAAVADGMPEDARSWYDEVFDSGDPDSWFALMDANNDCPPGAANIVLPRARNGENVILSHSGWGDGFYPLVVTRDTDDRVLGVHIDLLVVGPDEDEPDDQPLAQKPSAPARPSLMSRLFRRY